MLARSWLVVDPGAVNAEVLILSQQAGVISRRQALGAGFAPHDVRRLVRRDPHREDVERVAVDRRRTTLPAPEGACSTTSPGSVGVVHRDAAWRHHPCVEVPSQWVTRIRDTARTTRG